MLEKANIYIAVFAGLIMTAFNLYLGASLIDTSVRLIIIFVLFFILGTVAQSYMNKKIFPKPEPPKPDIQDDIDDITVEPEITEPFDDTGLDPFNISDNLDDSFQ